MNTDMVLCNYQPSSKLIKREPLWTLSSMDDRVDALWFGFGWIVLCVYLSIYFIEYWFYKYWFYRILIIEYFQFL